MTEAESVITIEEIAKSLREYRDQGQPSLIFLGARAGEFYRNAELYDALKQHIPEFQGASDPDRFRRCYEILSSYYNEQEIYEILSRASRARKYREEDSLLIELVQGGYANTIVTTHIGTLLENAFLPTGLKEGQDYQVIFPSREMESDGSPKFCQIFRIFGDLESRRYKTAGRVFNLEKDRILKGFLESEFQKNVLLIGHDPAWDRGVEPAFPPSGGMIYYINEDTPPQFSHLAHVLQQRPHKYLLGPQGGYPHFIRTLHEQLGRNVDLSPLSGSTVLSTPTDPLPKKRAFISYAHDDSTYLDRFEVHLKGTFNNDRERFVVWSDRDIQDGDLWQQEIEHALESASVAVLLVSADFLASTFIRDYELPVLLRHAKEKKVKLLIFVLNPCSIKKNADLMAYQIVNDPDGSFGKLDYHDRESAWCELADQVFNLLHTL